MKQQLDARQSTSLLQSFRRNRLDFLQVLYLFVEFFLNTIR